jgi:DNA-binding HxlR family transcriptional regulator
MRADHRSGCPINLMLEVLGDKWSLMIIRDMIFGNRRHFRELLQNSDEGIASNILADRLKSMLEQGIITKADDPSHKQKLIYSLTERGIELLPVLVQMAGWGHRYLPVTKQHSMATQLLVEGGPKMLKGFMAELRLEHLRGSARRKAVSRTPSISTAIWPRTELASARKTAQRPRSRVSRAS